jgi:hypothetical protein
MLCKSIIALFNSQRRRENTILLEQAPDAYKRPRAQHEAWVVRQRIVPVFRCKRHR